MPTPPKNKAEFLRRSNGGGCGNHVKSWTSYGSWFRERDLDALYGVRSFTPGDRRQKTFMSTLGTILYLKQHPPIETWGYIHESPSTQNMIIQGHLMYAEDGWLLEWSPRGELSLRDAMKQDFITTRGLLVPLCLREVLWPRSYDEVLGFAKLGGVVEFSAYNRSYGVDPKCNALIWEWRDY